MKMSFPKKFWYSRRQGDRTGYAGKGEGRVGHTGQTPMSTPRIAAVREQDAVTAHERQRAVGMFFAEQGESDGVSVALCW